MNDVHKYEYRNLSKQAPSSNTKRFQEPKFDVQPEQVVAKVGGARQDVHFHLDQTVAGQLGLAEKEQAALEKKVETEITLRWEKASEKAEVEGFTKGLEEGKAEAYKAELPRISERLNKLDFLLQEFDQFRERIFLANEAFLMDLIAQVAKMLILKEINVDKEYIHRIVIGLLHQMGTKEDTKIFLSEADISNVETLALSIQKEFGKLSTVQIEARAEIPVGGCKIETRSGVVDATVETQIQNIMKAMKA